MIMESAELSGTIDSHIVYSGECFRCGQEHGLVVGCAQEHAITLLRTLDEMNRIDFAVPEAEADPRFSIEYLHGDARGQMFGVLVCQDEQGGIHVLKAFSGQYNSVWCVPGWVPPLVDISALNRISFDVERAIKRMGRRIDELPVDSLERKDMVNERKAVSRELMKDIHRLYQIPNFRGELVSLPDAVFGNGGIPSGTGDCCAPKLLGHAALHGLIPLGLIEFYVGRDNRSGTKKHGRVYSSCADKCGRILGFMLCGLGDK